MHQNVVRKDAFKILNCLKKRGIFQALKCCLKRCFQTNKLFKEKSHFKSIKMLFEKMLSNY
jgi:hypothetical protein